MAQPDPLNTRPERSLRREGALRVDALPREGLARDALAATEVTLSFEDNRLASLVFGHYDQNLAHLERRLGVNLPLAELRYWMLGGPAPEVPGSGPVQTSSGTVPGFVQGGWAPLLVLFAIEAGIACLLAAAIVVPIVHRLVKPPAATGTST